MNNYEIKQQAKKERYEERAAKARERSASLYKSGRDRLDMIPFGQPILVGHHSERGDRSFRSKAIATMDRSFKESDKADYYEGKAERIGTAGVSSDDPEAVVKLLEKLGELKEQQERYKKINAVHAKFLKHGESALAAIEEKFHKTIREYVPEYSWNKHPIAGYQMTNLSANIRSVQKRIEILRAEASMTAREDVQGKGYIVREDKEENRIMFLFEGKPAEDVRALLKGHGFKWSPTRSAWVRMLNSSGRYAARFLISKLDNEAV